MLLGQLPVNLLCCIILSVISYNYLNGIGLAGLLPVAGLTGVAVNRLSNLFSKENHDAENNEANHDQRDGHHAFGRQFGLCR